MISKDNDAVVSVNIAQGLEIIAMPINVTTNTPQIITLTLSCDFHEI
jgi:hypothetical protein